MEQKSFTGREITVVVITEHLIKNRHCISTDLLTPWSVIRVNSQNQRILKCSWAFLAVPGLNGPNIPDETIPEKTHRWILKEHKTQ